ncbi:MAG: hypothetical protein H6731_10785 [Myxococcales bacterium]|nr:MAG: hypothetical protein H6731_10785 [Myxococcales bacterium]
MERYKEYRLIIDAKKLFFNILIMLSLAGCTDAENSPKAPRKSVKKWLDRFEIAFKASCKIDQDEWSNSEQFKLIFPEDEQKISAFILKKGSNGWSLLSPKFANENDLSRLHLLSEQGSLCLKMVRRKDQKINAVAITSDSLGTDKGIKQNVFEDYVAQKIKSGSWKIFFPKGYTKQLDDKGDFILE